MIRKAFLIGSPMLEDTNDYLSGVTPDIMNMKKHLLSNEGGAWNNDEIVIFDNPRKIYLKKEMMGKYDFVIIQYSGHGFEYSRNGTELNINTKDRISLQEIHSWIDCKKRYYFIDCCRGIVHEPLTKSTRLFSMMESDNLYIQNLYRRKYEAIINNCENGTSIIYSCGLNESADEDDGLGGIFSLSYFRTSDEINNISNNEYYSIRDVFNLAVVRMKDDYSMADQNPVMKPERRNNYFPFKI